MRRPHIGIERQLHGGKKPSFFFSRTLSREAFLEVGYCYSSGDGDFAGEEEVVEGEGLPANFMGLTGLKG